MRQLAQGQAVAHGQVARANEALPTFAQTQTFDRTARRVGPVQHPHGFAKLSRFFQHITQGCDKRVDAATQILQIHQQHVKAGHHRGRGAANLAIQAEHRNAEGWVDEIWRLNHIVLLVAAQPVLRAEGGGEVDAVGGGQCV